MAGKRDPKKSKKPKAEADLEKRLAAAMASHFALLDAKENTWMYRRDVAYSDANCWRIRSWLLQEQGKFTQAHQACKAADGLEATAVRMEKSTLGDRVFELEARLGQNRKTASALAELEEIED